MIFCLARGLFFSNWMYEKSEAVFTEGRWFLGDQLFMGEILDVTTPFHPGCWLVTTRITPLKTNIAPKNGCFQYESPFPGVHFQVLC